MEVRHLCNAGELGSELSGNEERQHKREADNKSLLCASRLMNPQLIECFVFQMSPVDLSGALMHISNAKTFLVREK